MPLRPKNPPPETLQDFELAAESRYYDGLSLMTDGRLLGGIYLMGYCAEMLLKLVCHRVQGLLPSDPISLGPLRRRAHVWYPGLDPEGYHSLWFWTLVLRRLRQDVGKSPLPPAIDLELRRCTVRLYRRWWVEARYRPLAPTERETLTVYNDVSWLRMQQHLLGS